MATCWLRTFSVAATLAGALALPAAARPSCTGDCDGNGAITVEEIVILANVALGNAPLETCPAGDTDGDQLVTVNEIVAAVIDALGGCTLPPESPTPIATSTPDAPRGPRLDVGSARGAAGSVVAVDVTLSGGMGIVTAAATDIAYDSTRVRVARHGDDIACTINPSIGSGTLPAKTLLVGTLPGRGASEILRVGLVSFTSTAPIPDGLLFTCEIAIDPAAAPGQVVLDNTPSAVTLVGERLNTSGADGVITIE